MEAYENSQCILIIQNLPFHSICGFLKSHLRKRGAGSESAHILPTFNEEVSARKEHNYIFMYGLAIFSGV